MKSDIARITAAGTLAALLTAAGMYFLSPLITEYKHADREGSRVVETSEFFDSVMPYLDTKTSRSHKNRFRRMVSRALRYAMEYHIDAPHEQTLFDGAVSRAEALGLVQGRETPDRLIEVVINGMLAALDSHSDFLPEEAAAAIRSPSHKPVIGLGMELTMVDGGAQIISPLDGTPAQRAGLQALDIVTHVDGRSVLGVTLTEVVGMARGEAGTSVKLSIQRRGLDPFIVTLTRAPIHLQSVRAWVEGSTGYIRIAAFNQQTHDRLRQALKSLQNQLGQQLNGLVLDLRNNPGGVRNQAVAVADDFLSEGVILTARARWQDGVEHFEADREEFTGNAPLVVLINEGSAAAAEIVASALQGHGRAVVMGRRSYGKGTQQSVIPMPYETAIRLTTYRLYGPSGRSFDAVGVLPDVSIADERPSRATSASDDAQAAAPAVVHKDRCPPAGDGGDRVLGCAIALLESGSLDAFLAQFRP